MFGIWCPVDVVVMFGNAPASRSWGKGDVENDNDTWS